MDGTTASRTALGALAITLALAGCGRHAQKATPSTETSATPVGYAEGDSLDKPKSPVPTAAKDPRAARLPSGAQVNAIASSEAKYVGPFPHRTNPFALPNADNAATAAKQRATEKRSEERLMGFVDVDGRKALLQIDGQVWAASAGESRGGIEVVEIAPAHVTLRRNGATWNVSLMTPGRSG